MTSFPLYDKLVREIDDTYNNTLNDYDKEFFNQNIKTFTQTEYELIYVLICVYQQNETSNQDNIGIIPYNGKKLKNGDITFRFDKLPPRLLLVLQQFIRTHIEAQTNN